MVHREGTLWRLEQDDRSIECVMRSCCSGAELQILVSEAPGTEPSIVQRELYPSKSDLYERARDLEIQFCTPPARP